MKHKKYFYFFKCLKCHQWLYCNGRIKNKKCPKCGKVNKFDIVAKQKYYCYTNQAPKIIQELKMRDSE